MSYRNSQGKYKSKGGIIIWALVAACIAAVLFLIVRPHFDQWYKVNELSASAIPAVIPTAHADTTITKEAAAYMSIEQLKKEMVDKIWNDESRKDIGKPGDLFITYDPSKSMRDSGVCVKIGGHRPIDCDSYGPMQEKIGTIQGYWPQMHDGENITQLDALAITQDVEKAKAFFLECVVKVPGCVMNWTYANSHPEYFNIVIPIIRAAQVK